MNALMQWIHRYYVLCYAKYSIGYEPSWKDIIISVFWKLLEDQLSKQERMQIPHRNSIPMYPKFDPCLRVRP